MHGTDQAELKKLGKYELIEIVGRGAMGEVYRPRIRSSAASSL